MLGSLGVTLDQVRAQVRRSVGQGDDVTTGQIPFTHLLVGWLIWG